MPTSLKTAFQEDEVKRECEKIFHPERFEFHELKTSLPTIETPNIDLGALFYAQQQRVSEPQLDFRPTEEDHKKVTFQEDNDNFQRKAFISHLEKRSEWVRNGQNRSKLIKIGQKRSKKVIYGQNGTKIVKYSQKGSK